MRSIVRVLGLFFILSIFQFNTPYDSHAVDVSLVGVAHQTLPGGSPLTFSKNFKFGQGLVLHFPEAITKFFNVPVGKGNLAFGIPIAITFGFEVGVFLIDREYTPSGGSVVSKPITVFPALLRIAANEAISLGVGGYFSLSRLSAAELTADDLVSSENGLLFSFRIDFAPSSAIGLMLDGRYGIGLSDAANASSLQYNDLQVLAGLRFGKLK